jgi:hypothetical protein
LPRKSLLTLLILLVAACAMPSTANADVLRGWAARDNADDVAINWYLSNPDADTYWVDYCRRHSAHKLSCDANISGSNEGSLRCSEITYNCYQTVTDFTCWKTVTSILSPHWQNIRVTRRVGVGHCRTRIRTEVY